MSSITLLGRSRRRRRGLSGSINLLGRSTACKTAKGKLRKGWRFGKGGRCIRAKGKR